MKILHMTQLLGVGGLERLIQGLILQQKNCGHEVALLVYGDDQTWVPLFRELGITVITDYKKSSGYDWKLLKHVQQQAQSFDIIHTHDLNPAMYAAPLRILAMLGGTTFPRWVHTAHGMDHITKRPITTWYERIFTRASDAVVGVAAHVCNTYRRVIWLSQKKIHQIDNGIAVTSLPKRARPERWARLKELYGLHVQGPVWICVSRVVPLKDQGLILTAAQDLPQSTFLLVGPSGDDHYWQELKAKCPSNVAMLGSQDNISELLSLADFYVSPSHHEGIPLAVLEAGAQGVPAVLSDIPGHKHLQQGNHPMALFFAKGSVGEFVQVARKLEADSTLAAELAQQFQTVVKSHYSQERMARDYQRVYEQVLA